MVIWKNGFQSRLEICYLSCFISFFMEQKVNVQNPLHYRMSQVLTRTVVTVHHQPYTKHEEMSFACLKFFELPKTLIDLVEENSRHVPQLLRAALVQSHVIRG